MVISRVGIRSSTFRLLALIICFFLTTGCATIVKGTTQGVPVSSDPSGADILVDGMLVGTTPTDIELKRKRDHLIVIEKKGYAPKSVAVVKNVGGAVWGNILAGGLIGWGVDATSGAQNNLSPKTIHVKLESEDAGSQSLAASQDSALAIKKLQELDQARENKIISDEEYTSARVALIEKYFPEMIPKVDDSDKSD